jgi:hypothetical protein
MMNPLVTDKIDDADLIPVTYPQSIMRAGAMGWGDAKGNPDSFRPREQTLSTELLDSVSRSDIAFEGSYARYKQTASLAYAPGPQIINQLAGVSGSIDTGLAREGMKFVDFGQLQEETIDLNRLSNAVVRGWYNMPGEAVKFETLSALQPDLPRKEAKNRPWLIRKSITANGLKYEISKELSAKIGAAASQPLYGSGDARAGFTVADGTSLNINKPMVIAFDTAELYDVVPPLPSNVTRLSAEDIEVEHVFTWRFRESGRRTEVRVRPNHLRRIAKDSGVEATYAPEAVTNLTTTLQQGQPARLALIAEARKAGQPNAQWFTLGEGDSFYGDDTVRLRLMLQDDAYIYIVAKDGKGQAAVLHPWVVGEALSTGREDLRTAGTYTFPRDFGMASDGLIYDPSEASGTESFMIIASKTRQPDLPEKLAAFARAARAAAGARAEGTESGRPFALGSDEASVADRFGLPSITRLPVGFEGVQVAPPATTTPNVPPPAPVQVPVFSGVDAATVITLNLYRRKAK